MDNSDESVKEEEEVETVESSSSDTKSNIDFEIESKNDLSCKPEELMTSPEVIIDQSDQLPVQEILNGNPLLKDENAEQVTFFRNLDFKNVSFLFNLP